jgi:hypothetical protein
MLDALLEVSPKARELFRLIEKHSNACSSDKLVEECSFTDNDPINKHSDDAVRTGLAELKKKLFEKTDLRLINNRKTQKYMIFQKDDPKYLALVPEKVMSIRKTISGLQTTEFSYISDLF